MVEIVDLNDCRLSRKNGMYGGAAGNLEDIFQENYKNVRNGKKWIDKRGEIL